MAHRTSSPVRFDNIIEWNEGAENLVGTSDRMIDEAAGTIREWEKATPDGKHIVTGDIRKLSARLFRQIEDKSIQNIFPLCEELLNQRTWALGVIAFDFAYRMKK